MFDFLKRRGAQRAKIWTSGRVTFVGEQRGAAEDAFTSALRLRFATDPRVRRAYLARVVYPKAGPQRAAEENRGPDGLAAPVEVALCLVAPEDVAIVQVVADEFRKLFASTQHMDTIFLSDAQELEVATVAPPFYRAAETT